MGRELVKPLGDYAAGDELAVTVGHAEPELREYLAEDRSDLRALYTNTMLEHSAESAKTTWLELSKAVDPLIAGKAVRLRRYELPDDHPVRALGHPCDWLALDAHDVLRSA